MRSLLFLYAIICLSGPALLAQSNEFENAADSDPQAKAMLENLGKKYEGMDPLRGKFSLEMQFPEQPAEVQEGMIIRSGDRYRITMGSHDVLSDGKAVYLILHNNKEVQINNIPEDSEAQGTFSPQAILNLHDSDQFVYVLGNVITKDGKVLQQIEFKPLDEYSDYSKLRMEIDSKANELSSATAFGKDGSRYIFRVSELGNAGQLPTDFFTFNKEDFPGYYVEDLR